MLTHEKLYDIILLILKLKEEQKMDAQKVDRFIIANKKYFPDDKIMYLKDKMLAAPEDKASLIYSLDLKDPTIFLLISAFVGTLGVDRFMLGDTGMGVLKLLTCGCCGILWIVDLCTITKKTKEANFQEVMQLL